MITSFGKPGLSVSRVPALDMWRGISVLLVIAHHCTVFRFGSAFASTFRMPDLLRQPTWHVLGAAGQRIFFLWGHNVGPLGVQIFFCISGYIITLLLMKERASTGRICLIGFYIRRAFRILPALIVFILLAAAFSFAGFISVSSSNVESAATFLCNTRMVDCGYYFGHLWSLSVEEQFYLFWPLIFMLAVGRRYINVIWLIVACCMAISVIPSLSPAGSPNNGLAFACISAGAAYALSPGFRSSLRLMASVPAWASTCFLIVILPLAGAAAGPVSIITTLLTPVLIVANVLTRTEPADANLHTSPLASAAAKWLAWIGLMSYSLYLWHVIFTWEPERYYSATFMTVALPLGLVLAWLSARFIEPYFTRIGRQLAARMRTGGDAAAPELRDATGPRPPRTSHIR